MSYETTIANAKARAAEHDWKLHKRHCPSCSAAASARKWDRLCIMGDRLYRDHGAAQAELRENRKLDKLPIPGQGVLA